MPIPKPKEKEIEKDFIARFMKDEEMIKDYPEEKQRVAVAYSTWKNNELSTKENSKRNDNSEIKEEWARPFEASFLEPGIVSYEDMNQGIAYLRKETIDTALSNQSKSLIGRPVIVLHRSDVTPKNMNNYAVGYVSEVFFNANDGKYWCKGIIYDNEAKDLVEKNGWSVSCAYDVLDTEGGGEHNAVKYDFEVTDFKMNHLALIETPRYEDSKIFLNSKISKGGEIMFGFKKLTNSEAEDIKKKEEELKKNAEAEEAKKKEEEMKKNAEAEEYIEIDGEKISLSELVKTWKAEQKEIEEKSKLDEESKKALAEEDEIKINGEKEGEEKVVKVKDLVASYKSAMNKCNEDLSKKEEDKVTLQKQNSKKGYFEVLKNAKQNEKLIDSTVSTVFANSIDERIKRGNERFGGKK